VSGAAKDALSKELVAAVASGAPPNPDFAWTIAYQAPHRDRQFGSANALYGAMGIAREVGRLPGSQLQGPATEGGGDAGGDEARKAQAPQFLMGRRVKGNLLQCGPMPRGAGFKNTCSGG
jgi:hypothetical protein